MTESPHHPLRGIALMLVAVVCFATLDTIGKYLTRFFSTPELVWARYTMHLLLMVVLLGPRLRLDLVRTTQPRLQVARGLLLVTCSLFFFSALRYLPLAEATAINFVSPIVVTVLSVVLLKEHVAGWRWAMVATGFFGVLIIVRPGNTLDTTGIAFALCSAFTYGLYQIMTRMIHPRESTMTSLFYTALVGSAVMSLSLPLVWHHGEVEPLHAVLMLSMGAIGGTGHFLLIRAFRQAPASTLTPFIYTQIVWATLFGWGLTGHLPDFWSVVGMLVIAASGLVLAFVARGAVKPRPPAEA